MIMKEEKNIENKNTQLNRNSDGKSNININIKEGFDGIRKSNSRVIFGILLGIIILDFAYECWH